MATSRPAAASPMVWAILAPVSAILTILIALAALAIPAVGSLHILDGPSLSLVAICALALSATVGSMVSLLRWRRESQALARLDAALASSGGLHDPRPGESGDIVLDGLVDSAFDAASGSLAGLGDFLLGLNDNLAVLQRSSMKFDLFASDILFSSRNLARQSEAQLDMLTMLRGKSEAYFAKLSATSRELEELTKGIEAYVAGAESMRDRAFGSRDLLQEVSRATAGATEAAKGGSASLSATGSSAASMLSGIKQLDSLLDRQAAEAKRIGEALRVIEDIVERTHVLATNASIEAAHAGARGAGFSVIAQEIRQLAASSRASLASIGAVLNSIAKGIESSARLSTSSRESAAGFSSAVADSQERFASIVERVGAVDRILGEFAEVFSSQIEAASGLATTAAEASTRIERFDSVFSEGAADYRAIAESAGQAEAGATEARRASRVLAQLSGYLKIGGHERNRVLKRYKVLESATSRKHPRKEGRQLLLYNLEVYEDDGVLLGYLGDLSRSGMLLLADTELAQGSRHRVRIVLPLSAEGERSHSLTIEIRRVERDHEGLKIGCLFVEAERAAEKAIDELLSTLSLEAITKGALDAQEAMDIKGVIDSSGIANSPGASDSARPRRMTGGRPAVAIGKRREPLPDDEGLLDAEPLDAEEIE